MKRRPYFQTVVSVVLCLALLMPCISVSAAGLGDLLTPSLSEDEVPATLDFEEMKAKGHVKRLYEEETELNQAIFENEDGTRTAHLFTVPTNPVPVQKGEQAWDLRSASRSFIPTVQKCIFPPSREKERKFPSFLQVDNPVFY